MQLRDIQYVLTIADEGGFSKAAERLYVSQPALSQSVQRLEEELGVKLFDREKNKVSLTFAGSKFLEEGKVIIHLSERLKQTMADIATSKQGELTIGISPFYQKCFLTRISPVFQARYPGVKLNVVDIFSNKQEEMLLKRQIELGIMVLPVTSEELDYEKLYDDNIMLAIPEGNACFDFLPELLQGHCAVTDLTVLKDENFVMYKPGRRIWDICMTLCREAGFDPKVVYETNGCESVNSAVVRGMGVGFVPISIKRACPDERAVYYKIDNVKAFRTLAAVYRSDELSCMGREFIRIAHNIADQIKTEMLKE